MINESLSQNSTIAQLNNFLNGLDELGLLNDEIINGVVEHPEKYTREFDLIEVLYHYTQALAHEFNSRPSEKQERIKLLQQEVSKAIKNGYTADQLEKDLMAFGDAHGTRRPGAITRLEGVAKKYQSKAGGLNDKGRAHYNRKGHNLKKPVSKGQAKKSKKSAGRRKSFCSRMGGQKKMHNIDCRANPDKAICKSLKRWDCNEAFEQKLNDILEGGGHEFRNLTSNSFEKKLKRANTDAMQNSGRLYYPEKDRRRKELLKQAEQQRPLRRSEFIKLYGYDAWLEYCLKNDIPEDTKWTVRENIGDHLYPGQEQIDGDFADTDKLPVDNKIIKVIRTIIKGITYPIYGPIVDLIDKFVPTAILSEVIKTIRLYGDTIVGDIRSKRELQWALRQAVINRKNIINKRHVEAILAGDFDDELEDILYNGVDNNTLITKSLA